MDTPLPKCSIHQVSLWWIVFFSLTSFVVADDAPPKTKWGDLTGRFLFEGEPPKPIEVTIDKDEKHVKAPILDESLVVDEKTHGISNILVRLIPKRDEVLEVHQDYEKSAKDTVFMLWEGFRLVPHFALVRVGQTLEVGSKDPVGHNPTVDFFENVSWSDHIPATSTVRRTLIKAEATPCHVGCSIHPWESGRLMVADHPYMSLTSGTGEFTLKNLPVGKHSFRIWHERCGYVTKVRSGDQNREWKKGLVEVEIKPARNELGDIFVPAEMLTRRR